MSQAGQLSRNTILDPGPLQPPLSRLFRAWNSEAPDQSQNGETSVKIKLERGSQDSVPPGASGSVEQEVSQDRWRPLS